ncbi:hypothetical protein D3C73_1379330 [compost metagenome]
MEALLQQPDHIDPSGGLPDAEVSRFQLYDASQQSFDRNNGPIGQEGSEHNDKKEGDELKHQRKVQGPVGCLIDDCCRYEFDKSQRQIQIPVLHIHEHAFPSIQLPVHVAAGIPLLRPRLQSVEFHIRFRT